MHFTTSAVLTTLAAAGSVAANNLNHGHAHFHAKRDVEKRQYENVDWAKALKDVDWKTVDFNGGKSAAPTPAPAAPAPAASKQPDVVAAAAVKPTSAPSKPAPASSSAAPAKPSESKPADSKPASGGAATDLMNISAWSKLGVMGSGVNAKAANSATMWLGSDGRYKATFTNDGSKAVALLCWQGNQMWINAAEPEIFVNLKGGESVTVSIPQGKSGGCGAALPDSVLVDGQLSESILEFHANDNNLGAHDISREINMTGVVLTSKGSRCTSGVIGNEMSCVYVCKSGNKCMAAGSYGIALGAAEKGPCMIGTDDQGGRAGGCQFGSNGEHLQVTIAGHRNWPGPNTQVY